MPMMGVFPATGVAGTSAFGPLRHAHGVEFAGASIATITLPKKGLYLNSIDLVGGAAAGGAFTLIYDGQSVAHFPVSKSGFVTHPVNWQVTGNVIASSLQGTDATAPLRVCLRFSEVPLPGAPPIEAYRAIFFTATAGGATASQTAFTSVSYDGGEGIPIAVLAQVTTGNAQFFFPSFGGFQAQHEACLETNTELSPIAPAPVLPPANALVPLFTGSAAQTVRAWVFYKTTSGT